MCSEFEAAPVPPMKEQGSKLQGGINRRNGSLPGVKNWLECLQLPHLVLCGSIVSAPAHTESSWSRRQVNGPPMQHMLQPLPQRCSDRFQQLQRLPGLLQASLRQVHVAAMVHVLVALQQWRRQFCLGREG